MSTLTMRHSTSNSLVTFWAREISAWGTFWAEIVIARSRPAVGLRIASRVPLSTPPEYATAIFFPRYFAWIWAIFSRKISDTCTYSCGDVETHPSNDFWMWEVREESTLAIPAFLRMTESTILTTWSAVKFVVSMRGILLSKL